MIQKTELLSYDQLCDRLQTSRNNIHRLITKDKEFPFMRINGKYLFNLEKVLIYLEKTTNESKKNKTIVDGK